MSAAREGNRREVRERMEVNNIESKCSSALEHDFSLKHELCSRAGKRGEFTLGPIIFHLSSCSLLVPKAATNSHRSPPSTLTVWDNPEGRRKGVKFERKTSLNSRHRNQTSHIFKHVESNVCMYVCWRAQNEAMIDWNRKKGKRHEKERQSCYAACFLCWIYTFELVAEKHKKYVCAPRRKSMKERANIFDMTNYMAREQE